MLGKKLINAGPVGSSGPTPSNYFNTVLYTGNGGTQRVGGYINRGAVFTGGNSSTGSKISISNDVYGNSTSVFSVSMWVNSNTNSGEIPLIGNGGTIGGTTGYAVYLNNGELTLTFRTNPNQDFYYTNTSLYQQGWKHIVLTVNEGVYVLYLDGTSVLNGTTSNWSNNPTPTYDTFIGNRWNRNETGVLDGKIDQVRIFDKAISSSEVTTLYGETYASTTKSTTDIFDDNSGVALYQLDGNANDTGGVSGYIGEGAIFNGSSSKITLPNSTAGIGETDSSFSFWVYPVSVSSGYEIVALLTNNDWIEIRYNSSGQFQIYPARQSNSTYMSFSAVSKAANNWYNIVITRDSATSTIKLYIDGSLVETNTSWDGTLTSAASDPNGLGANVSSNTLHFSGKLDQVRIYSKALSSSEVSTLYGETASSNITISDLVAYYPMEGTSLDQEGSYHGTDSNVEYNYNGTASNVTYQEATNFSPDLVWIKNRDTSGKWHSLTDSVRGAGKRIFSNETNAELTDTYDVQSFDSNGFTIGNGDFVSRNNESHVAWCFNAGTDAAASNTDGTITSTVKANTDAGFSVVKWTGNGTNGATIGHGLSNSPEIIITKGLSNPTSWVVGIGGVSGFGVNDYMTLQTTGAKGSTTTFYQAYGTDTFTVGVSAANEMNKNSSNDYISYCFHSVDGIQKVGSYTGTGAAGNIIETGFEPAFVMIKCSSAANGWIIWDNKRGGDKSLFPHSSIAEVSSTYDVDFTSNGFIIQSTNTPENASGQTFIYLAIAADPDTTTPTVENSFEVVTYTGNGGTQSIDTGFKPDLVWIKNRTSSQPHRLVDSVRGSLNLLFPDLTNANDGPSSGYPSIASNGFQLNGAESNASSTDYVAWCWKAGDHDDNLPQINTEGTIDSVVSVNDAAGFSIVKYTGDGNDGSSIGHGLSQRPDLIFVKGLDNARTWMVKEFTTMTSDNNYLALSGSDAIKTSGSSTFIKSTSDSSVIVLGDSERVNFAEDYIAYCFTSITGYQKIGSYTADNQTTKNITTGFRPRFLLLKRTNSAQNWVLVDSLRSNNELYANTSGSEATEASIPTFYDNGFTLHNTRYNGGTDNYIYLAIA